MGCNHEEIELLNPYEIVWKYRCKKCKEVFMCSCEEDVARFYVPHQLDKGCNLETQERIPVTLGFVDNICDSCRGNKKKPFPKAPMMGATSKIRRYYWKEILYIKIRKTIEFAKNNNCDSYDAVLKKYPEKIEQFENEALNEIKELHAKHPLYEYEDISQQEIIEKYNIDMIEFEANYIKSEEKKVIIEYKNEKYNVEEFIRRKYEEKGFKTLILESIPFHVLFATIFNNIIQNIDDEKVRRTSFGDREYRGIMISALLPSDFGTSGYYKRKREIIDNFLKKFTSKELLIEEFTQNLNNPISENLRQYLWAIDIEKIEIARKLLDIIDHNIMKNILLYLIKDYWKNYCGWPDLICYTDEKVLFVEVKSSTDKLSEDQKNWIEGNYKELSIDFEIAKVIRLKT